MGVSIHEMVNSETTSINKSSSAFLNPTKKDMTRIQFSELMPAWLFQYCSTVPKVINKLLLGMGLCNIFLLMAVLQTTTLPNLGVSPIFVAFLLCSQNGMTWFALNNHRLSSYSRLPTIVANDFIVGCLLGITIGGSIVAFILSQFFGQISNCVSIKMTNFEYTCQHQGTMKAIWFWSGLIFWINTTLAVLIVYAKDELGYLQHANYESIGLALEELQSTFERTAVYKQSPGDGTFFGSAASVEQPEYPMTPSQEEAMKAADGMPTRGGGGGYGAETGFDGPRQSPSERGREEARQVFL